nr:hypothetical protein [Tanacetum cinerariifolium]
MVKLKNQTLDSFVIKRKLGGTTQNSSSNPINQESKRIKTSIDEPDQNRNQQEPPVSENPRTSVDTFIVGGFDKWKKVNDGKRCAFLKHIGCSQHKNAIALGENLLNQATHIGNILEKRCVEKGIHTFVSWLMSREMNKKEQMAIVLRFVDRDGVIRERFVDLVHVEDTLALTLKTHLWNKLLLYEFDTSKIRCQRYDGASNMRGEWNGFHALVLKDCPYAYYVLCFAHRLQLALAVASREVIPKAKVIETKTLLELGEIKKGIIDDTSSYPSERGDADGVYCQQERLRLRHELELFPIEMQNNPKLSDASTIADLCTRLVETKKAMKICKTRLRNKMGDEFLADNLVVYIEKEIAEKFDSNSIIDEFKAVKSRKADL